MMPVLIPGPKQPGNDIDVYLRPLVEEQQDFVTFLKEANLTAAQIAEGEDIPKADVVVKWTYEIGKTLVPPK